MSKKYPFFAKLLIMVLCLSLVFCGCGRAGDGGEDGTKQEPKTPSQQLSYSVEKTFGKIMGGDSGLSVVEDVLSKGKITIEAMDMVENVLYIDPSNNYYADFLDLNIQGQEIGGSIYLKDSALALVFPMLLGEEAYGLDLETASEDIKTSPIWEMMGISYEDFQAESDMDIDKLVDTVTDMLDSVGTLEKAIEEAASDVKVTSEEGKASIYGEEVDAIIVSVDFTSADVKKIAEAYMGWAEDTLRSTMDELSEAAGGLDLEDMYGTQISEMDDALSAFDEVDLTYNVEVNIDPKTEYMMSLEMEMAGTVDGDEGKAELDLILGKDPTSSDKYTLTFEVESDDTKNSIEAVLTRDIGDTVDVSELTIEVIEDEEREEVFTASLEYDKESFDYELTMEADGTDVVIDGTFQLNDELFELGVDSVTVDGDIQKLDILIRMEEADDIPAMPEYQNVLRMDENELTSLMESISSMMGY